MYLKKIYYSIKSLCILWNAVKRKFIFRIFLLTLSIFGLIASLSLIIDFASIILESEENYTIIVLPDTQHYPEYYPYIFDNQTQWITENIDPLNIVFVTHLGGIVEHSNNITQWENANRSMSKLDNKVPYGVLPGNHDGFYETLTNYNKYFGIDRFKGQSWYGGAYQQNNTNNYHLFSAGKRDYLIFHLAYDPDNATHAWANNIIDNNPTRTVIISTHRFMAGHGGDQRSPDGDKMWENLVKPHSDQIILVQSGHLPTEEKRTDIVNGNPVHQLLIDYQNRENGGNGWLRILEFSPTQNKIFVKTFSPYLNEFENDADSQFTLDISRPPINDDSFSFLIVAVLISLVVVGFLVMYLIKRRI